MLKNSVTRLYLPFLFYLVLASCSEEEPIVETNVSPSLADQEITYIIENQKYTESMQNVKKGYFVNPEVDRILSGIDPLKVYIDPNVPNTYHLSISRKEFEETPNTSLNSRVNCDYSTLKIYLYSLKNTSGTRVDFLYNNNRDNYELLLYNVYDEDYEDGYIDFSDRTSSMKLERSRRGGDCGIWDLRLIDLDVTTPTLENRQFVDISFGPGNSDSNRSFVLPDFSVFRFDNKLDKITLKFRDWSGS